MRIPFHEMTQLIFNIVIYTVIYTVYSSFGLIISFFMRLLDIMAFGNYRYPENVYSLNFQKDLSMI